MIPTYVYTYTTAADSTDQSVTYTNTRTPFKVEIHVAITENGSVYLRDDMRSGTVSDYTPEMIDIGESLDLATASLNPLAAPYRDDYVFAGIVYGKHPDDGSAAHPLVTVEDIASSVAYQLIHAPGTYYDLFFNGDENLLLGGDVSVNDNGTLNDISDDYSELTGGYQIYYIYYKLPKIYYVRQTAAGTLVQYNPITRNGAPVSLNGKTVAQGDAVQIGESGTVISQSAAGGYRVPPDLDGSGVLSSDYLKIGVGESGATNVSALAATNDNKQLYLHAFDGKLKWSFDNSNWNDFTDDPAIYVIYRDEQDNKLVIVREDGKDDQDFWYTVTGPGGITIEVCIPAGRDSVTITGVPYGEYTVVEKADWSWRYDSENSKTAIVYGPEDPRPQGAPIGEATVHFSGPQNNEYWLNGIDREENQFTSP